MSYIVGNLMQGFSSGGWKNQHNIHHAATNVVGRDGDLDLMPFFATVISDLKVSDFGRVWRGFFKQRFLTLLLRFPGISWLFNLHYTLCIFDFLVNWRILLGPSIFALPTPVLDVYFAVVALELAHAIYPICDHDGRQFLRGKMAVLESFGTWK